MTIMSDSESHNRRARLQFTGSPEAVLFSRELAESFDGVMAKNRIVAGGGLSTGAFTASVDGRPWFDTIWMRDNGAMLRELVHYGEFEAAKALFLALTRSVEPNADGFWTFPMFTKIGGKESGHEWDGTALIVVSSLLLWERLPLADPVRRQIEDFLLAPESPIRAVTDAITRHQLVAGSGEFGGGLGVEGLFFNVVQNAMIAWMLDLAATRFRAPGGRSDGLRRDCASAGAALKAKLISHFVAADQTWIWALDTKTYAPSEAAMAASENQGFGGVNGVFSHASDVHGLLPLAGAESWVAPSMQTFLALLSRPQRMEQFARHGLWTQFNLLHEGYLTGPSYGQGYALQMMLLLDRPELYTAGANWLVRATYAPEYPITRSNPYWFYERYYSPDDPSRKTRDEGCGALNLVCVAEPLKIARLMAGVDDHADGEVTLVPRLPVGWTGLNVAALPVRTTAGHTLLDFDVTMDASTGAVHRVQGKSEGALPQLKVRLGTARQPIWRTVAAGAREFACLG